MTDSCGGQCKDIQEDILGLYKSDAGSAGRDTVDTRVTEKNITDASEIYRFIFDHVKVGIALISPKMEILALNAEMRRWFPAIEPHKRPKCFGSFNNPPLEDICPWCPTHKTLKDGQIHESVTNTPTPDGIKNYRIVSSPVHDVSGKVIAAIEMVDDITVESEAEHRLRDSEERFRAINEAAQDAIVLMNFDGEVSSWNKAAESMFGYTAEEALGRNVHQLLAPTRLHEQHLQEFEVYRHTGEGAAVGKTVELPAIRKDGSEFVVELSLSATKINGKWCAIGIIRDVTDRKNFELMLREHYNFLQDVIDAVPNPLIFSNRDGLYIGCNKAMESFLGKPRAHIIGNARSDILPTLFAPNSEDAADSLLESGGTETFEARLQDRGGETRDVLIHRASYSDVRGSVAGAIALVTDITDLKRAESRIQKRFEFEASIARASQALISRGASDPKVLLSELGRAMNADQVVLLRDPGSDSSDALAEYWQRPGTESDIDKLRAESRDALNSVITRALSEDHPLRAFTLDSRSGDGSHFLADVLQSSLLVMPIFDLKDTVMGALIFARESDEPWRPEDIAAIRILAKLIGVVWEREVTRRLHAQTILNYTAMINTVPAIVYMKDTEQKYIIVNDAFHEFAGSEPIDVRGKTDSDIFPKEIADMLVQSDNAVLATAEKQTIHEQLISVPTRGEIWITSTRAPIADSNGQLTGVVGMMQDVTEQHRSREQLMQADKLAAIGTLAAGVAHEINNPMGFITSNLNTMKRYLQEVSARCSEADEKYSEMLKDFEDAINESIEGAGRVRKIVADLKSFSRLDKADVTTADINEGIESTLNIVWNELKYHCKVEKELGDIPRIMCIPSQLNQVFLNMLVNAGHAVDHDHGLILIKTWADESSVYVSIRDNGKGIPPENLSRIFEPFFTTKEVGKGTGLGLSLAFDIIKKHGGFINVWSQVGEGTEFAITLPRKGLGE